MVMTELKDSIKLAYIAMDLVSEPDLSKLTEENFEDSKLLDYKQKS